MCSRVSQLLPRLVHVAFFVLVVALEFELRKCCAHLRKSTSLNMNRPQLLVLASVFTVLFAYRIVDTPDQAAQTPVFTVGLPGAAGRETDPRHEKYNAQIHPVGAPGSVTQPNIYRGTLPRVTCPGGGSHGCSSDLAGKCDSRTGLWVCTPGYSGRSCEKCKATHVRDASEACVLRIQCPKDCSGKGACNATTGRCDCRQGMTGLDCSAEVCKSSDPFCKSCEPSGRCAVCEGGFFLNRTWSQSSPLCVPCVVFDPACSSCVEARCSECADPLLTGARATGARAVDMAAYSGTLAAWLAARGLPSPGPAGTCCRPADPLALAADAEAANALPGHHVAFGSHDPECSGAARVFELVR